jgi:hypothetical protein
MSSGCALERAGQLTALEVDQVKVLCANDVGIGDGLPKCREGVILFTAPTGLEWPF